MESPINQPLSIYLTGPTFPPDVTTAAHWLYELGEGLSARGHRVTVIAPMPSWRAREEDRRTYRGKWRTRSSEGGMDVIRVRAFFLSRKATPFAKAIDYASRMLAQLVGSLMTERHDVFLIYSPPLFSGLTGWALKVFRRVPFVFNVQDIHPQCAIDLGKLRNPLLIALARRLERFAYRHASYISVHSNGNKEFLDSYADASKVVVIENWTDIHKIQPGPHDTEYRRICGGDEVFIVSYAGTVGWAQDLGTVLESAGLLHGYEDIKFLIVGDGLEKDELIERARKLRLANVIFLPLQPYEKYPLVLSASNACLVNLKPQIGTPVVPSKLLNIMAAGRPVVGSMPLDGDAPKLIEKAECGICVEPGDAKALARAILTLYHDPVLREELGRKGRQYAERNLSLESAVARYEALLYRTARTLDPSR